MRLPAEPRRKEEGWGELEREIYVRVLSAHFAEHHSRSRTSACFSLAVGASFLLAPFFAMGFFGRDHWGRVLRHEPHA